jgi:hypothetical protein
MKMRLYICKKKHEAFGQMQLQPGGLFTPASFSVILGAIFSF